ncbi:hypothetical protein P7C70_g3575, partial [Phenoliferia sp. Uapishka_3]
MNAAAKLLDKSMPDPDGVPTSHNANPSHDPEKFADPSGEMMQALAWQAKNSVAMIEAHKPKVVDPSDVVLKVSGSTICGLLTLASYPSSSLLTSSRIEYAGSDLHLLHGAIIELEKGDILGHECGKFLPSLKRGSIADSTSDAAVMGIVESVGPEVTKVKIGDRCVASFNIACGKCDPDVDSFGLSLVEPSERDVRQSYLRNVRILVRLAEMGSDDLAESFEPFQNSHFTGGFAGGQAEYVRVPWGDANLLKIPEGVPDEAALYLSDVLVTSYHCVVDTGVKKGDIVGIWGAGPIGLLCAKWAFLKGASRVIAIDKGWRLNYCKSKIPELELLDFGVHKDVAKRIEEMTASDPNSFEDSRPPGLECAAGEYAKGWMHKVEMAVGLETDTSEILNEMIASIINFGAIGITGVYSGCPGSSLLGGDPQRLSRNEENRRRRPHRYPAVSRVEQQFTPGGVDACVASLSRIPIEKVAEYYTRHDKREEGIMKTFVATKFSSPPSAGAPKFEA